MRTAPNKRIEKYRKVHPTLGPSPVDSDYGYFFINGMNIISSGCHPDPDDPTSQWEHVSVSLPKRVPTWSELCFVKDLFWGPEETVLQFHPKKSDYVNITETCLHLWKKVGVIHELPPGECV